MCRLFREPADLFLRGGEVCGEPVAFGGERRQGAGEFGGRDFGLFGVGAVLLPCFSCGGGIRFG